MKKPADDHFAVISNESHKFNQALREENDRRTLSALIDE